MAASPRRYLLPVLFPAGVAALTAAVARYGLEVAPEPSGAALPPETPQPLRPGGEVAFFALGSVGGKPWEAIGPPVLWAVRERYGDRIEVVFHDVRKDRSMGRKWRIGPIPAQLFLHPDGAGCFRHEGFFALREVEKMLADMEMG
ncbi:MAG: hypothetical protein Kow0092_39540 [Deferrisomatales bacterium]